MAIGTNALGANSTASNNTAVGQNALLGTTTGHSNVGVGTSAGGDATTATGNTCIGYYAGDACTTGGTNTCIGYQAGGYTGLTNAITTGTENVVIGTNVLTSASNANRQIVIGYDYTGNGDNKVNFGSSGGYVWNSFTANNTWTQVSDERTKKNIEEDSLGLEFVNELRPVTFNWRHSTEIDPDFIEETVNIGRGEKDTETLIHGLIAQDVKAAMDKVGNTTFNGWEEGQDGQAVSREMFITPLINAVKELSAKVEVLEKQLNNCLLYTSPSPRD